MVPMDVLIYTYLSTQAYLTYLIYTDDWGLYAIITNSVLSLPPYTDTQMLKESETLFLMYPSIHCTYRNPQTEFGVNTFIYKRDWCHFSPFKPGVF